MKREYFKIISVDGWSDAVGLWNWIPNSKIEEMKSSSLTYHKIDNKLLTFCVIRELLKNEHIHLLSINNVENGRIDYHFIEEIPKEESFETIYF